MSDEASGLRRRLAAIIAGFFETELGLSPRRVNVLDEQGEDLIVIKVEGFMTQAEAALAERTDSREILDEYYARVLERVSPRLSVTLEDAAPRRLRACRTILDLSRDECLYLLILGMDAPEESVSSETAEGRE
jgi:uncharacterized protein YbcI